MRRNHPGIGGWRNDNPRHFRPRSGGTQHFRPGRGYGLGDAPRFQTPGPRFMGPHSYHNAPGNDNIHSDHDRNFRGNRRNAYNPPRYPDRGHQYSTNQGQRQIFPLLQKLRQGENQSNMNMEYQDNNSYQDQTYFENKKLQRVNNMGDVDLRQPPQNNEPFHRRPSPWAKPPFNYEDTSPAKQRHNEEHNRMPIDYQGHRPPASDHYGNNKGPTMDNSNTFSRSVDDTVNMVRERLLSRETQPCNDSTPNISNESEKLRQPSTSSYSNAHQEQQPKRKPSKMKSIKTNCDKIKNKIVHQLFKMDKDKIHKLMDNPNSSTKFEYAISSLITESQNSYNRHLRSVAEKSLSSTSSDFIQNDSNTIYEDTFMKQMEGLLDPQDTVFLEDIKPMVLAELNKVLQLGDLEHDEATYACNELSQYNQYSNEFYEYDEYTPFSPSDEYDSYCERKTECYDIPNYRNEHITEIDNNQNQPLFERRQSRKSQEYSHRRIPSSEREIERRSFERHSQEERSGTPIPLFDTNAEHISDDDDPFAELDRQYHVAVDHNFIDNEYFSSPQSNASQPTQAPLPEKETPKAPTIDKPAPKSKQSSTKYTPEVNSIKIKQEIDNQLQNMAKSPLKFLSPPSVTQSETPIKSEPQIKQELSTCEVTPTKSDPVDVVQKEKHPKLKIAVTESTPEKPDNSSNIIITTPSDSRKRALDQRPSHRKEKRKKSESSQSDSNSKQILNKNIIINVNDCAKDCVVENRDAPKSVFNLFFSKEKPNKESSKDSKKVDSNDKCYSDKYVKRKEKESSSKKSKDKEKDESKKKHDSSSSNHSILSPSDTSAGSIPTPTKMEAQIKLKPIDMFMDQPKKTNAVHHAHRNTAPTPAATSKVETKPIIISRKLTRKHASTQVMRKTMCKEVQTEESRASSSRFCQTERKRLITRGSQTDSVSINTNAKSDPFERMKQIDMEIQSLLQEKFKLYNSLENQDPCPSTMQSLGMAVLNVTPAEANEAESTLSEDMIVDEFTSIPVEELEQIALETVQDARSRVKATPEKKRSRRSKEKTNEVIEKDRKSSRSPLTSKRPKRKAKTPNISLIEQIIADDRALEEIISLDDLETSPNKTSDKKKSTDSIESQPSKISDRKQSLDDFETCSSNISDKKKGRPKKKVTKKKVSKTYTVLDEPAIKECRVVLKREDLQKLVQKLKKDGNKSVNPKTTDKPSNDPAPADTQAVEIEFEPVKSEDPTADQAENVVEETVLNDIQFDMLDVSEDIVIGDVCEVKSSEGKDADLSEQQPGEEIILDNSQSSQAESSAPETADDNETKMFDYSSDENLRRDSITVSGNGDAVLAIEPIDNNFLAACLDGNVYYFSGEGQLLNTMRGSNLAVTCLSIVREPCGTTVYTGSLDSRIRYYDLETGMEKGPECNVLSPIQTMDRAWGTIFVGTRTGFVLQFECKNNILIPVSTVKFSEQSILALRAMKEGPRKVLLVAARSEPVTIKDAQTGLLLRSLEGPKMTVYTLLLEDGKVYCGTSSHLIHVFEYSSGSHVGVHSGGKGAVCVRAAGGLVFAGCYDGCVYVFREGEERALAQLRGPSLMLLSLAVHASKVIAGYKDRSLYIWKIPLHITQEMIL